MTEEGEYDREGRRRHLWYIYEKPRQVVRCLEQSTAPVLPQWPAVLVQVQQGRDCSWSNRPSSSSNKLLYGSNNLRQKRATKTKWKEKEWQEAPLKESDEREMHLREEQRLMEVK